MCICVYMYICIKHIFTDVQMYYTYAAYLFVYHFWSGRNALRLFWGGPSQWDGIGRARGWASKTASTRGPITIIIIIIIIMFISIIIIIIIIFHTTSIIITIISIILTTIIVVIIIIAAVGASRFGAGPAEL